MNSLPLTNPFGAPIYHEESVSNTFDMARARAAGSTAHGTVFTADFQTAGRGRLNRQWAAEKGKNLLFTIMLRCGNYASIPEALTLRTGLAVSLAIEELVPGLAGSVLVKWPNDIMLRLPGPAGKSEAAGNVPAAFKAAGILTETDGGSIYIGVGVNVSQTEFPGEHRSGAASIIQLCPDLPDNARFVLLEKILVRLYGEIEEPAGRQPWRECLEKRLYKKGETVTFAEGAADSQRMTRGILSGLGPGGELLIIPEGKKEAAAFITGELRVY